MEMWRYSPSAAEMNNPALHEYLKDGKWRWTPHDVEASWHEHAYSNSIHSYIQNAGLGAPNWQGTSALLRAILQRPEMRGRFANTLVDLIEGVCAPANVNKTLDNLLSKIGHEHSYTYTAGGFVDYNAYWQTYWEPIHENRPTMNSIQNSRQQIRTYASARPAAMLGFIGQPWGASNNSGLGFNQSSRYAVNLTVETVGDGKAGGEAVMNSRPVSKAATGNYYSGTAIQITAKPYPGYVVKGWELNSAAQGSANSITVNSASTVRLTFEKCPDFAQNGDLRIDMVKAESYNSTASDWIEIFNPTDRAISTKGLYLTDNTGSGESNIAKWQMPSLVVRAGETVRIITSGNIEHDSLKRMQTNFNIGLTERLRLTKSNGDTIKELQRVEVSFMRKEDVQRRYDDGRWHVVKPAPPPPPPPPPDSVPVQLMVMDTVYGGAWDRPITGETEIVTGNGTFTARLDIPSGARPTFLPAVAIKSFGTDFTDSIDAIGPDAEPAHARFANARFTFNSVKINGNSVGLRNNTDIRFVANWDHFNGFVHIEAWTAWWEPSQRITGVDTVPVGSNPQPFNNALSFPGGVSSIEIEFTVSGVV